MSDEALDEAVSLSDDSAVARLVTTADSFTIVHASEAWERMCGYKEENVIGRRPNLLQGRGTSAEELRALHRALREEQKHCGTLINYTRSGVAFTNELTIRPLLVDGNGQATHFEATMRLPASLDGEDGSRPLPCYVEARLETESESFAALSPAATLLELAVVKAAGERGVVIENATPEMFAAAMTACAAVGLAAQVTGGVLLASGAEEEHNDSQQEVVCSFEWGAGHVAVVHGEEPPLLLGKLTESGCFVHATAEEAALIGPQLEDELLCSYFDGRSSVRSLLALSPAPDASPLAEWGRSSASPVERD